MAESKPKGYKGKHTGKGGAHVEGTPKLAMLKTIKGQARAYGQKITKSDTDN